MKWQHRIQYSLIACLLLVSLLLPLLGGCATSPTEATPTASPAKTVSPTKTAPAISPTTTGPTGSLTIGIESLGEETWPGAKTPFRAAIPVTSVFDPLIRIDENGQLVPCLAEKWEMSPDGMTYTFDIRKGVQFHDGWGELTAEDVKFSLEQVVAEDSRSVNRGMFDPIVASVEVVNPYKIVLHMKEPNWQLPYLIVQYSPGSLFITSKKYFDTKGQAEAAKHPVGTGPYNFVEHKLGEYIKLEAVENHWRKTPEVKTITIMNVPEVATMVALFKTGKLDAFQITPDYISEVKGVAGAQIITSPTDTYCAWLQGQYLPTVAGYDPELTWAPRVDEPHDWTKPETLSEWNLKSLKVRQALNLIIDKQSIVDNVLMGYGSVAEVPLYFRHYVGYNPNWKPSEYDPEKARQLLAEAGYEPGDIKVKVVLAFFATSTNMKIAEAIAMQWAKFGINVEMETMDYSQEYRKKASNRETAGYVYVSRDPSYFEYYLYMIYIAYSTSYFGWAWDDPEFDKIMDKVAVELDVNKRAELERQLGDYAYAGSLAVPIAYADALIAASSKIKSWDLVPVEVYAVVELESITLK